MKIRCMWKQKAQECEFPMDVLALRDLFDRLRCEDGRTEIDISFMETSGHLPEAMMGKAYHANLYLVNVFAQRFEGMDAMHRAMLSAAVQTHELTDLNDLVRMTYGLDEIPVIPAADFAEVGELCIDGEMLPIIERCPDELLPLLDREKVGRMMAEQNVGVIVNGYYCEVGGYEVPDIRIKIHEPQEVFFRLRIGPDTPDGALRSQWLDLPCPTDSLDHFSDNGISVKKMCCYEYETSLPQLAWNMTGGMEQIFALNALAHHLSCLSREEFIKCKAVMEAENVYSLADTMALVQRLGEYDFDASITDEDAFAQRYLHQNLPPEFDAAVLGGAELFDLGTALLHRKHGSLTSYGVISHDEPLYAVIESPTEQAEDLDNGMGGLHL